jgi:hypothetical protein
MVKTFNVAIMSSCQFPSSKLFSHIVLFKLVEKTKKIVCFALLINFLGFYWKPKQITLGLFETIKTTRQDLLDANGLRNKIITYVKDEGSNLNTLTSVLKFAVKCETLDLEESF